MSGTPHAPNAPGAPLQMMPLILASPGNTAAMRDANSVSTMIHWASDWLRK